MNKKFAAIFSLKHVMPAIALIVFNGVTFAQTQVTLNADGPGNTYELINSVLAPGYTAVEHPECATGHTTYGRHIAEVLDTTLNKNVFEFYSHVAEDNDRCINFDRQRVEIKTYDQSPAHLIGTAGESVTYKWQFRLAPGFQVSTNFTHIHQVKAVGGDDGDPIFTLTARKGTPNKLELIHNNVTKVTTATLSSFAGVWVEATETLTIGANGTYSMLIKRMTDDVTLLSYSSNDIMTIRPTNDFIRPKWGIYRSLNNAGDLRDDSIRFGTISIAENNIVVPLQLTSFTATQSAGNITLNWTTTAEINLENFAVERSDDGNRFHPIHILTAAGNNNSMQKYLYIDKVPLSGNNYYRLKQINRDGSSNYSRIIAVDVPQKDAAMLSVYPNPVINRINVVFPIAGIRVKAIIINSAGVCSASIATNSDNISVALTNVLPVLKKGWYNLYVTDGKQTYHSSFIKE